MTEDEVDGLVVVLAVDVLVFRETPTIGDVRMYEPQQRQAGVCGLASLIPDQEGYVRVDFGDGWFSHLASHQYRVPPALEQLAGCAE